jgi:hypothetical protein
MAVTKRKNRAPAGRDVVWLVTGLPARNVVIMVV